MPSASRRSSEVGFTNAEVHVGSVGAGLLGLRRSSASTKIAAPSMIATSATLNTPVRSQPTPMFKKSTTLPLVARSIQFEMPPATNSARPTPRQRVSWKRKTPMASTSQDEARANREQRGPSGRRQIGPDAQKCSRVLRVSEPHRIRQVRLSRPAGERLRCHVLGHAVAADRRDDHEQQGEPLPILVSIALHALRPNELHLASVWRRLPMSSQLANPFVHTCRQILTAPGSRNLSKQLHVGI